MLSTTGKHPAIDDDSHASLRVFCCQQRRHLLTASGPVARDGDGPVALPEQRQPLLIVELGFRGQGQVHRLQGLLVPRTSPRAPAPPRYNLRTRAVDAAAYGGPGQGQTSFPRPTTATTASRFRIFSRCTAHRALSSSMAAM